MTTFQQWLAKQEDGPQDDPVAWLARAWKSQEGKRPRVSSASGIEKHMLTLGSGDEAAQDNWTGYVHQATGEATGRFKADQLAGQTAKQAASGSDTSRVRPSRAARHRAARHQRGDRQAGGDRHQRAVAHIPRRIAVRLVRDL